MECLQVLSDAASKQPGNEKEIFRVLIQLPSITKAHLPYNFDHHRLAGGDSAEDAVLKQLVTSLSKGFNDRLKKLLSCAEEENAESVRRHTDGESTSLCECIDSLVILGGEEFSKEKLRQALTWSLDLLLQNNMDYVADILENIEQVENNFAALIDDVTVIALDMNKALFLCSSISLTYEQQMDFISSSMLEKLSIELLTLVDSVKEAVLKNFSPDSARASIGSGPQYNLFSALTATIGEDAFLKRKELISLAKIASMFLKLESRLHECDYTRMLKENESMERSKKSSLKSASQLPDLLRSSHQSSLIRSTRAYGHWNWQEILNDIGPLITRSIGKVFDDCLTEEINTARNYYHLDDLCKLSLTSSTSSSLFAANSGVPTQSISCFTQLLNLMKTLLPFAVLGSEYKPLQGLSSQYMDECSQALKSLKSFLMTIHNDVPSKAPIISLHHALATCEDVCTMLTYCASKIQPDPRVPFQGILQVYKDLNKMLRDTIIHHHYARLTTYLLHDAESHHWSDPRELNEGESPSYSIQMWNVSLQKLWFELRSCVSETQTHKIFVEIFCHSLDTLSQRYMRCTPSYNRTKQIKLDIVSILLISLSFQFHWDLNCSIFPSDIQWQLLEVKHLLSKIEAACQNLLTVLSILSCPLAVMQKGISDHVDCEGINWRHLVHPSMFLLDWDGSLSGLSDEAAVVCSLSLCSIHSSQSLTHCLFALRTRKCFLLKKLLTQGSKLHEIISSFDVEDDIIRVLCSCDDGRCVGTLFKCVFKTNEDTSTLLKACILRVDNDLQPWQKHFFRALHDSIRSSLSKVVRYITHLTWTPMGVTVVSSLPANFQSPIINLADPFANDGSNCLLVCLLLVTQGITHCLYSIPDWLEAFFNNLVYATSKDKSPKNTLLGNCVLHVLVHAAVHCLKSSEKWEEDYGVELTRENMEVMARVADLFTKFCTEGKLPDGARQITDLIMNELEGLKQTSASLFGDSSRTDHSLEYSDQQLFEECSRQVSNMTPEAVKSLTSIKDLLVRNLGTLKQEWKFETILTSDDPDQSVDHVIHSSDKFNPMAAWRSIGGEFFDHGTLIDFSPNWEAILKPVLSAMGVESLSGLLLHRWEMRGDACLQDEERELVSEIKKLMSHADTVDAKENPL